MNPTTEFRDRTDLCLCKNYDVDRLCSDCTADQVTAQLISVLVFCFTDSTIPLLHKSKISGLQSSSFTARTGLCQMRDQFSSIKAQNISATAQEKQQFAYAKTKTQISFAVTANQRFCFCYMDSIISLLRKF